MQIKKIKIEAFDKNWKSYSLIGLTNISIPFVLIAIGTSKINSYLGDFDEHNAFKRIDPSTRF